jgi:hypothetical protein
MRPPSGNAWISVAGWTAAASDAVKWQGPAVESLQQGRWADRSWIDSPGMQQQGPLQVGVGAAKVAVAPRASQRTSQTAAVLCI